MTSKVFFHLNSHWIRNYLDKRLPRFSLPTPPIPITKIASSFTKAPELSFKSKLFLSITISSNSISFISFTDRGLSTKQLQQVGMCFPTLFEGTGLSVKQKTCSLTFISELIQQIIHVATRARRKDAVEITSPIIETGKLYKSKWSDPAYSKRNVKLPNYP